MKKILFIFLVLFAFNFTIKADDGFYLGKKIPDMYIESIRGNDIHNGAPFILHRNSDNGFVYCIDPFTMMSTTDVYKAYTYNDPIFNLTDEEINMMNIISYYGYGYKNHADIKWFGITQYFLWKNLGYDDVYFTDTYYGNRVDKYQSEISELETLVNNYYKLPSFNNRSYKYEVNKSYEIVDANNVLSNYKIKESNIEASIENNKLTINTKSSGSYKITFVRKSPINKNYLLYYLDGSQSLFYPGKINDITFSISIEVNGGNITINKRDAENKERLEASLSGSKFGIYQDNVLINELIIDSSNTTSISNLPFGTYVIKELTNSKGYNKDSNIYNVDISETNKDIVINSYSKVIEGNLIINKYYGSDDNYKLDEEAVFEIYNNGNLMKTITSNTTLKLEYGTYLIKQVSGKKYYNLVDDFIVSVSEEKDYTYNLYTDKTDEIKAYEELLNKREESLNKKEQELIELQNKIQSEKNELINLKQEIKNKEIELDNKNNEVKLKEDELKRLEDELYSLKNDVEASFDVIKEKEANLNKAKKELDLLNDYIKEQETLLNKTKYELKQKEIELNKKEQELIKSKEEILIVNVPNTYKKNYNKLISILLICLGSLIIILRKKKTTDC